MITFRMMIIIRCWPLIQSSTSSLFLPSSPDSRNKFFRWPNSSLELSSFELSSLEFSSLELQFKLSLFEFVTIGIDIIGIIIIGIASLQLSSLKLSSLELSLLELSSCPSTHRQKIFLSSDYLQLLDMHCGQETGLVNESKGELELQS